MCIMQAHLLSRWVMMTYSVVISVLLLHRICLELYVLHNLYSVTAFWEYVLFSSLFIKFSLFSYSLNNAELIFIIPNWFVATTDEVGYSFDEVVYLV